MASSQKINQSICACTIVGFFLESHKSFTQVKNSMFAVGVPFIGSHSLGFKTAPRPGSQEPSHKENNFPHTMEPNCSVTTSCCKGTRPE